MTNIIRNVFARIGHVMETSLVDPKEQYQAVLLGDSLAYHSHEGGYDKHAQIQALNAARAARQAGSQKRAA